jgi:ParB family chromosome partitioning protein
MKNTINTVHIPGSIYDITVADVNPNSDQPRKYFGREAMRELKESIADLGLINAVTFTKIEGHLQLVTGERRLRAVKALGLENIRAMYVDKNQLAITLAENFQREDLNPIEKAELLHKLKEHGYSQQKICALIKKSAASVSELLSLNRLPDDIKSVCRTSNKYVMTRLIKIAKAPDINTMRKQFKEYQKELNGGNRKSESKINQNRIQEVMVLLNRTSTKTQGIDIDSLSKEDACILLMKLNEVEQVICKKANEIRI